MLWFLPHQLFSPLNFFHQDQFFTSKKGGQKRPPHAKSLACGLTFMQRLGFNTVACKSVFYVLSQEVNKHIFKLYCYIAREQAMVTICKLFARMQAVIVTVDCAK
jgi:hypothetical protein